MVLQGPADQKEPQGLDFGTICLLYSACSGQQPPSGTPVHINYRKELGMVAQVCSLMPREAEAG